MSQTMPDHATEKQAADAGARAVKGLLDELRRDAIRDDDFTEDRMPQIAGGGRSREHYALAAAEWGMAYGYLQRMAGR